MTDSSLSFTITNLPETQAVARELAALIEAPITLALDGDLGAGKTQFVRFFAQALGTAADQVTSPTYVLLQRYQGTEQLLYHFDFYRLETESQVWDLGIDELYEQEVVVLIEWASKFRNCLPEDYLHLEFLHPDAQTRTLNLTSHGSRSRRILEGL